MKGYGMFNSEKSLMVAIMLIGITMFSLPNCSCSNGFAEAPKTAAPQAKQKIVQSTPAKTDTASAKQQVKNGGKIYVYYFMTSYRCPSCQKIEKYTRAEVEASFKDELKSGSMEWKMLNIQDKQNEHFAKDYSLYSKSVVLSCVKDGKEMGWKNCAKIWELLGDENAFRVYIREEIKAFEKEFKS
ncbi:MAG: hypothetical protein A2268_07295 [Candidatus Raymondbacteria bacterium RifOxyA12_full_50_37]|nr:MAG: hypothetical protein A2268_07295 [Candidatus Raymondbacteria bacterium RifOxyA12_full_50_37]OGJ97585.1 MAG: hypothetical protein A2453_02205 [Candidatus Raymondbacteria bacterium RIFOXYC2_FULL_50_21]